MDIAAMDHLIKSRGPQAGNYCFGWWLIFTIFPIFWIWCWKKIIQYRLLLGIKHCIWMATLYNGMFLFFLLVSQWHGFALEIYFIVSRSYSMDVVYDYILWMPLSLECSDCFSTTITRHFFFHEYGKCFSTTLHVPFSLECVIRFSIQNFTCHFYGVLQVLFNDSI